MVVAGQALLKPAFPSNGRFRQVSGTLAPAEATAVVHPMGRLSRAAGTILTGLLGVFSGAPSDNSQTGAGGPTQETSQIADENKKKKDDAGAGSGSGSGGGGQ